jgi:hypothetical protein
MSAPRLRALRTSVAMLGVLALSACGPLRGAPSVPDIQSEWGATTAQAEREALASRFGIADKLLVDFAARHPATVEGYEASFWRALYKLDPANGTATPRDAAVLLDAYLAASLAAPHRAAATTLRHVATALERAPAASVSASGAPSMPASASDKARDEELTRVKDELAKANAELERIKKRVAAPKP